MPREIAAILSLIPARVRVLGFVGLVLAAVWLASASSGQGETSTALEITPREYESR